MTNYHSLLTNYELLGWTATCVALAGVWLNNKRRRECFILWIFSNSASAVIHLATGPTALVFRDLAFLALAVHGFFLWGRKAGTGDRGPGTGDPERPLNPQSAIANPQSNQSAITRVCSDRKRTRCSAKRSN